MMWWRGFWSLIASLMFSSAMAEPQLAFPGAEGFGKYTQGGRGGQVYVVTSLNDDARHPQPGTLRHAVKQKGHRIVVFAVSGVIQLEKPLEIKEDFITLAGQTSPGGIVISGAQTSISASQVIIRYLRFRPGKDQGEGDALNGRNQSNIIVDHCSMSWSNDEVASFYNNRNFTLQYSIIAESLNNAGHSKGEHGYGGIWGGANASFVHNVIAHHHSRNPRINGYRLKPPYPQSDELTDVRYNVIYNWGDNSGYGGEGGRFNLVDNYFKPGPASKPKRFFQLWYDDSLPASRAYIHGNLMAGNDLLSDDNRLGIEVKNQKKLSPEQVANYFAISLVTQALGEVNGLQPISSAQEAYQTLILQAEVGANRNGRGKFQDSVDHRVLEDIRQGTVRSDNGIIDAETEVISDWSVYAQEFNTDYGQNQLPDTPDAVSSWLDRLGAF